MALIVGSPPPGTITAVGSATSSKVVSAPTVKGVSVGVDLERGAGDRVVVAEHTHGGVAEPLGHRDHLEIEDVAVGWLQEFRAARLGQAGGTADCRRAN